MGWRRANSKEIGFNVRKQLCALFCPHFTIERYICGRQPRPDHHTRTAGCSESVVARSTCQLARKINILHDSFSIQRSIQRSTGNCWLVGRLRPRRLSFIASLHSDRVGALAEKSWICARPRQDPPALTFCPEFTHFCRRYQLNWKVAPVLLYIHRLYSAVTSGDGRQDPAPSFSLWSIPATNRYRKSIDTSTKLGISTGHRANLI